MTIIVVASILGGCFVVLLVVLWAAHRHPISAADESWAAMDRDQRPRLTPPVPQAATPAISNGELSEVETDRRPPLPQLAKQRSDLIPTQRTTSGIPATSDDQAERRREMSLKSMPHPQ